MSDAPRRVSPVRRLAAVAALALGALTVLAAVVMVAVDPVRGVLTFVALLEAGVCAWSAVPRVGAARRVRLGLAVVLVVAVVVLGVRAGFPWALGVGVATAALAVGAAQIALGARGSAGGQWTPVPPATHGVLLVNPHSGDGRAAAAHLADHARDRGLEVVELGKDDDLLALAERAAAAGADVLGMAGGDGSMALVAEVARRHGLAFVCVPAGTRNHFAQDLGLRRTDLLGGLDAFTDGVEMRVDLARVNNRPFVNNVSVGLYAEAVHDPRYRSHKVATLLRTLRPEGPKGSEGPEGGTGGAAGRTSAAGVVVTDDAGVRHTQAAMIVVSNNPYALHRVLATTTRPRLDGGELGVVVAQPGPGADWVAPEVTLESDRAPTVAVAIDGEAVTLVAPLRLVSEGRALRVRIPSDAPGLSPSARLPPRLRGVVGRLMGLAVDGRLGAVDERDPGRPRPGG